MICAVCPPRSSLLVYYYYFSLTPILLLRTSASLSTSSRLPQFCARSTLCDDSYTRAVLGGSCVASTYLTPPEALFTCAIVVQAESYAIRYQKGKNITMDISQELPSRSIFGPSDMTKESDGDDSDSSQSTPHYSSATPTTPAKLANKNVAPFLAKHIPEQYAPLRSRTGEKSDSYKANSKYCYRHRPDLKCRRQADEPSMDKLQHVRFSVSFFCAENM